MKKDTSLYDLNIHVANHDIMACGPLVTKPKERDGKKKPTLMNNSNHYYLFITIYKLVVKRDLGSIWYYHFLLE
jgi:hypothetical protein